MHVLIYVYTCRYVFIYAYVNVCVYMCMHRHFEDIQDWKANTLHIGLKKMRTQFFLTGSVTPHFFPGSLGLVRDSDASSPKSLSVDKLNTFCCCCESRTSYRSFLEY